MDGPYFGVDAHSHCLTSNLYSYAGIKNVILIGELLYLWVFVDSVNHFAYLAIIT